MKDVYQVLQQKELEISRLEIEVEALRIAAPLLSDDGEIGDDNANLDSLDCGVATPLGSTGGKRLPQPEHSAEWKETAKGWP